MLNLLEAVRSNPRINRLEIGDFLFAEFTCGIAEDKAALWADQDYLVHVLTGRKTWHTAEGVFEVNPGDSVFFRKGAALVEQHLEVDFCLLMFFIPDRLVRSAVREYAGSLKPPREKDAPLHSAVRVVNDSALAGFFASMRAYFSGKETPSEPLLALKLKELVISILTSGKNPDLAGYF